MTLRVRERTEFTHKLFEAQWIQQLVQCREDERPMFLEAAGEAWLEWCRRLSRTSRGTHKNGGSRLGRRKRVNIADVKAGVDEVQAKNQQNFAGYDIPPFSFSSQHILIYRQEPISNDVDHNKNLSR